jgi:hypothetical protein
MKRGHLMERGRPARHDQCGQDARAPSVDQLKWRTRWPPIRAFPHSRLHRGTRTFRKSSAKGCATTPVDGPSRWGGFSLTDSARVNKTSRDYYGERWQSGANGSRRMRNRPKHRRGEKPRERGLEVRRGSETATRRQTPGLTPPTAAKARQRAFAKESDPMAPQREGPVTGVGLGPFPNAACRRNPKLVHVDNLGRVLEFLGKQCLIVYTTGQHARTPRAWHEARI